MITIKYSKPSKLKNVKQSAYVYFEYDRHIVDVIRSIYPRYYDALNKVWEIPYDYVPYLQDNIKNEEFSVVGKPINEKTYKKKTVKDYTLPKTLKTALYDYQKDVFNEGMTYDKYMLLLEPGLGKTIITSSIVKKRKELNHITNCLVIVCVSGLKYTWESEIKKHFGDGSVVLGNRKNTKGFYEVKSNKDKLVDIKTIKTDNDNYIYITNIESLRDKKILEELKKLFKNGTLNCLVVDECHKVKSTSSIQGKALISLSKYTKYMYELTGTIITNSPIDLYLHLKCMGIEKNTLRSFKMHYCIMGGFNNYQIVGYKHLDELQHKLNQVSIRLRKNDVLSLPDKVFIDEYVDMSTKQLKIYNDVKLAISQDIDNIALSLNPLSQLTRLRQATADTSILSSNVSESAKFVRAKELIADIVANGNSVIVFSEFTTVIDNFYCELLKDYKKVAKVTGKTKDRENQIKLFTNDKDCSIILGTEALQTGYTLTKATTVIFLDEPWSASQRLQATDRIHRIGQNSSVNIITLMCKNSIDEYVHQIVLKKEALSDALVDKKYDIHDKNVLNFLITGEGVID